MISLDHPDVASWFEEVDDLWNPRGVAWRCKQTGFSIMGALLDFYRTFGGTALFGLTYLGLPESEEIYPLLDEVFPPYKVTVQKFERAVVTYDPDHVLDQPPGAGALYLLHKEATCKRALWWNPDTWEYYGITSSWRYIGVSSEALKKENTADPDWWQTKIGKDEGIRYISAQHMRSTYTPIDFSKFG